MTTLTIQSHLQTNLTALGLRNADLAEKLASIESNSGIIFSPTPQGVPSATHEGRQLCSRQRPLDEAAAMVKNIDLIENAVVVVLGFGLGYHVRKLVEDSKKATLVIVFEPDLSLLRTVFEQIDHSRWLRDALVVFVTDANDRGTLGKKLEGAEAILAQGVAFLEHPASRARLRAQAEAFTTLFSDFISAAKTTLMTTLLRSVDTVRNLMLNIDHYAAGPGIADLHNLAKGFPAVVVSAGPSLHKNVHQLKQQGVRDRCVIIAVQTTLKPLLEAGIKPHFVTALDYHEISKRFYEGLNADDLRDVTLIAEPKANPVILDSFPGAVRCSGNGFLDQALGDGLKRDMGNLAAGATVAHLAVYFARFLGCNPIAMIGQDLGFTDGLYYAPGAAIHDVWAPELNPFNTIEMMEWQRIARHRLHLHKTTDVRGKSIYTDAQMHVYLQQFERDFAQYKSEGLTIIDASEGGVAKQHTIAMPLAAFLADHAQRTLPALPSPAIKFDTARLKSAERRVTDVRKDVRSLKDVSQKTEKLLRTMLDEQHDQAKMAKHFHKVEQYRKEVEQRFAAFELINHLNQLGVFKRLKADRRLHMRRDLGPMEKQRGELERDLDNVAWIADAAQEMIEQLELSGRLLAGEQIDFRPNSKTKLLQNDEILASQPPSRVAALIAIDPHRNGLGIPRSLAEQFNGKTVLQATLERMGQSQKIESIILIAPEETDIESLIDRKRISLPIEIEQCNGSPFGPEHEAIAAARLWSDSCWRGGIAGMSIYDEILCPQVMREIMQRRGLTAALLVGPDWPLVNVTDQGGCDAVVSRHLEHPNQHNLVFTQSPPGLCGCVISASLMKELSRRNRLSTVGGLLVYQPHAPQHDPIAREANVQIEQSVRRSLIRATFDSPRQRELIDAAMNSNPGSVASVVDSVETAARGLARPQLALPRHVTLELCTERTSTGLFSKHPSGPLARAPITLQLAERIFSQITETSDTVVTLNGVGDPLLHPQFDDIIRLATKHNIRGVCVRTELLCDQATLDRLLGSGVDVISVDLNADRAATYQFMMGIDRFKEVLINIQYLLDHRRRLTPQPGNAAFALPWIVPHLQRRAETYEDIDTFFDRWQHTLGTAVIDGPPPFEDDQWLGTSKPRHSDALTPAVTPPHVVERDQSQHMTIFCDGSVPLDDWDWPCREPAGNVTTSSLRDIWKIVLGRRANAESRHSNFLEKVRVSSPTSLDIDDTATIATRATQSPP